MKIATYPKVLATSLFLCGPAFAEPDVAVNDALENNKEYRLISTTTTSEATLLSKTVKRTETVDQSTGKATVVEEETNGVYFRGLFGAKTTTTRVYESN